MSLSNWLRGITRQDNNQDGSDRVSDRTERLDEVEELLNEVDEEVALMMDECEEFDRADVAVGD